MFNIQGTRITLFSKELDEMIHDIVMFYELKPKVGFA